MGNVEMSALSGVIVSKYLQDDGGGLHQILVPVLWHVSVWLAVTKVE